MIFQFKISLLELKPEVWRRVLIDPTMTMEEMHYVMQSVMGWYAEHLYEFRSGKRVLIDPDGDDEDGEFSDEVLVGQAFRKKGDKWTYTYDFGDNWEHVIELEEILDRENGLEYPLCVDGANACPPEDSGGIPGYLNLQAVLKNPKDPEYAEIVEWLGKDFDASYFNKDAVNEELHDPENWVEEGEFDDDTEEE